jgi:hypothetical protein
MRPGSPRYPKEIDGAVADFRALEHKVKRMVRAAGLPRLCLCARS